MSEVNAVLQGRWVRFRAIDPADYLQIRQAETASPIAFRWRHAGQQIPPEHYAESLFAGVLASFLYESHRGTRGLGVVTAYGADPRHGFAYFGIAQLESFGGALLDSQCAVEATRLFLDYMFQGWNFRKIYLECAEYNLEQFGSFLEHLDHESTLEQHLFLGGRYWSMNTFAIWRERWPLLRNHGLANPS